MRNKPVTTPRGRSQSKFTPKRRVCPMCANKALVLDYKNPVTLRPFVSERGKIESRRRSGACAKHQRMIAQEIKRARHLALLPFTAAHLREAGGAGARG